MSRVRLEAQALHKEVHEIEARISRMRDLALTIIGAWAPR
jgi:sensor domain CHASE-containing protein